MVGSRTKGVLLAELEQIVNLFTSTRRNGHLPGLEKGRKFTSDRIHNLSQRSSIRTSDFLQGWAVNARCP